MTSLSLLSWIVLCIVLQLILFLGFNFWKHWITYQALRDRAQEPNISLDQNRAPGRHEKYPPAWSGFRSFIVKEKFFEDAIQSVCSFVLIPEDGRALPSFLPGQFLTFQFEVPATAGAVDQLIRCYSISDQARPEAYRISVKRALPPVACAVPVGRVSNFLHDHIEPGARLQVRAPAGNFYLGRGDTPVVLIAGGIGITPLMSMLNWCLAEQAGREIWLFYGVRNSHELVMKAHLKAMATAHQNFHLRLSFSDPMAELGTSQGEQYLGRIDVDLLRRQLPLKPYHFYLCGPAAMLESLVPALEEWGVPDAHIHFEAFGPASVKRRKKSSIPIAPQTENENGEFMVSFIQSGKSFPWNASAGNLLDFSEANGIVVSSGCRAGSCGSCQTTIRDGEVVYLNPPDFDPEIGTCLLCQCQPKTSLSLEA